MFGALKQGSFTQSWWLYDFILEEELRRFCTQETRFANTASPQLENGLRKVFGEKVEFRSSVCCQMKLEADTGRSFQVPHGISVRRLIHKDSAAVANLWQYSRENGGASYPAACIKKFPAFGAFDEKQTLIASVMCHLDRSIGALTVKEEFRRRGLARVLMSYQIRELEHLDFPDIVVQSVETNVASIALLTSLGFVKFAQKSAWLFLELLDS